MLIDGPDDAPRTFAFAPGAGGGIRSAFMAHVARELAAAGIRVVRFEFPATARNRAPLLMDFWREVIGELGSERLVIGGKSMGGRIATMVADDAGVRGVVCFGYPFHPPGKPEQTRTAHLAALRTPTLILQGTRDPFGTREDVAGYTLSPAIRVEWFEDGDHSLKPRKASGATEAQHLAHATHLAAHFMTSI